MESGLEGISSFFTNRSVFDKEFPAKQQKSDNW
jgi:hypothetical protein